MKPATFPEPASVSDAVARQYLLTGIVQGVGFRPFVYRLAHKLNIRGWVENRLGQVCIHAEASPEILTRFEQLLLQQAPEHARPQLGEAGNAEFLNHAGFEILNSTTDTEADIHISSDLPVCSECLAEISSPGERRFRYPFTNCTNCGPRYSIIHTLPYDRKNTSMTDFMICPDCQAEYNNPDDRRFHAEPIACPECGPELTFTSEDTESHNDNALDACIEALRQGNIIAIKGTGGYHLVCDAGNNQAIATLRQRKARPDKPLAVMMSAAQLDQHVHISTAEQRLLENSAHPIVLLDRKETSGLPDLLSPGLDSLGVLLPYTPLHHLLINDFGSPLVVTSANISGEPVITRIDDIRQRLHGVIDACLDINRPIVRPADDSVYGFIANKPRPLRIGRGTAPLELDLPVKLARPVLAVGGQMKNTIALAWDKRIVISPHIGDLQNLRSQQVFEQVIADYQKLYRQQARHIVCDSHPGYSSHRWSKLQDLPYSTVFHHHAHAACLAGEYPEIDRWLAFTWDGTGLGPDGTIHGGEALLGHSGHWQQVASIRPFSLPGADKASRQPWRSAAAACWETGHEIPVTSQQHEYLHEAWQKRINCHQTSSVGRLFDAAAALTGITQNSSYDGHAAMLLEAQARQARASAIELPLSLDEKGTWRSDWSPLIPLLADTGLGIAERARCFHESLAKAVLDQCRQLREQHGQFTVGLCGGVFQNRLLAGLIMNLLENNDFDCYMPERVPLNDAGLCFGQVIEYAASQAGGHS